MKQIPKLSVMLLLLCLPILAGEVEEILAKNLEAHGGLKKIKAVQSRVIDLKVIIQGGAMEIPMKMSVNHPDKVRMEGNFQGMSFVQAYDGKTAWQIMPFTGSTDPQPMDERMAKQVIDRSDLHGILVDYKEKGSKVELLGKEEVEGSEAFKLKVTQKDGSETIVYLDTEEYIEIKMVAESINQMGMPMVAHTYFSDYKPVDGVMVAHHMQTKDENGVVVAEVVVNKVEHNTKLDDSIFSMPPVPEKPEAAADKDGQ